MRLLATIGLFLAALSAQAAHTQATLVLAAETAKPGEAVLAGVRLRMDARWHTYWRNSGASGSPTTIEWQLPPGVTAGQIQWPVPVKLPEQDLTTYIYTNDVLLIVPLKLAADLKPGPLTCEAKVSWLECDQQCVPGKATAQATLNIGPDSKPSKDAALLDQWQKKIPKRNADIGAKAWWEKAANDTTRPLILTWKSVKPAGEADFFPNGYEKFEIQGETERVPAETGWISLRKQVKKFSGDWPAKVAGVVVQQSGSEQTACEVDVAIGSGPAGSSALPPSASESTPPLEPASLWQMLLYAFIGGLILNVMPCVLPVIALKILGFVGQAKDEPGRVRALGLLYGLGVLGSFLVLAAVVIGVKAAGHKAGWGMQFGNPEFLVVLTVLVTLVALNLFGLFEINPSGRVLSAAGTLASKHGAAGAFFNGVLATILATPCTAPFLGAALGFAFSQSPGIILLTFSVVALGLASPYMVLSWQPAWLKFLPKPGAWMQRFKVAMGFPMLATAIWLFSLTPIHYGSRTLWLGIFLVVIAMAAWVYGEFVQRGGERRWVAAAIALALVLVGYGYALEGQLQWRSPVAEASAREALQETPDGINWQRWSPQAVAQARAEGHPVLVDFTADWCLTCQANKRFALETRSVRKKLRDIDAVAFVGDYTKLPDDITSELNRYGRAGVPLVLVFRKSPKAAPAVLPETLTPGIVLSALDSAAK